MARGAGNTMEHDTGSGHDPAASSMPDQPSSPPPSEAAETAEDSAPAEPEESGEAPATTGEPRVDAVLGRLSELDELPVSEHPGVYERIHEQLVDVLGTADGMRRPGQRDARARGG
jgi:hypothetical protein